MPTTKELSMARPVKCRRVCSLPLHDTFRPVGKPAGAEVSMTVEEYEAIRLIDLLGYTQEEAGEYMAIARTTVQSIYNDARHKLAEVLVNGMTLRISGGNYELCSLSGGGCTGCGGRCPGKGKCPGERK